MEDDERTQKLKAGKQKLAEFQKKRKKKKTHLPKNVGEEEPVTMATDQSEASLSSSGDVSFSDSDQGMTETAPDDTRTSLRTQTALYAAYDKIEELEESLAGKQLALDKVISENDQLQRKIQESKLNDLESAVKKREELIVQLSSALQTVTSQTPSDAIATEMAQEVQNLKSQLLNASKMLETQREKYLTTTQTLQEAKAEISILQKHLRERDKGQEVKESPATNQEEPSQLQAANEERLQLEQELLEARNQIASLQERLRDNATGNDEKLSQILGELEALQEVVISKDNQLLDLQSRVSASEEKRDKLQSRISDIEEERDRLNNIVSSLEARILENDGLKEENDKLKTNIQDVEERSRKELEQIKNENVEVLENLRNDNAKEAECLLNERNELKSKLGEFENSIKETTEMKLKMKDLEEKLKEMEEKSASESGELDLMRTDYELLTETLKLKNERIAELERSVTEEKHEIEIELLRGDNELLSEQVRSLEEKLEGSEKNIAEKGRQLEFVRTELEELESRLRDKDEIAFMYETSISNLQREKEQQALEMDQLNEELENALLKCKRTNELDLQLESLVSQLNGLQQECQCYRVQNDELKNKINVQQDLYLSQQYQIEVAGREKEQLLTENQCLGSEKEELRQEVLKLQVAVENSGIAKSKDLMEGNVESRKKGEKEMKEMEAKIQHLKEENLSWKMKVQSMEDKILDLQKDLEVSQDSTAAEIGKLHDLYKQEILDKDDVINSLQTEIKNYKSNTNKENSSAAVGKHEDWKTSENIDNNSITESMMESVVEDLLCQSEAAIEKEAGSEKEAPIANWEKENICEEIELVQEEMIPVSHINLLTSSEEQSSKPRKDNNGGDQDEPLELGASNIGGDEEEISHLQHSLSAPRDSEVTEERTTQSSLSENESSRLDNTQEEIRSVLNLESSVSLDSENFLMILKTLENQKHHLLEKLKQTEAERDKLRSKFQNTKTDEISDDSLNLNDSIDEDNARSQTQFIEDEIIVREETNERFVEGSIVDETEDGVDGPDSLEVNFLDTSSPDNGAVTRILDEEGAPPAHEMEAGRQEEVTMAVEPKKTQVSPCMLSSGAAASSVSVDALTNSSSVYVSVDNVTVQIPPTVSTTAHNAGELSNVTDTIPPGLISTAFGSGDLSNKNTKTMSGDFPTDTSADVSSFDSAMASEDTVNVSDMEDLSFTRMASLTSKNESLQIKIDSLIVDSGECEDLKDRCTQVSNRFDVFKASFSDISIKNKNLEYDNEELSSKLENLQKELEDVRADYSSLQDHYDMVGDENHSLRYEHDQLRQKYEALMSENSSLLQSLSDSDVMGTKILRESEEIVTKLSEMEEENSRLSQQLSRSEKANLELEAEIEGLGKKLDKANVKYESLLLEKSELAENHRKLLNEMKIVQKEKLDSLRKSQNLQQKLELQIQENEDVRCAKISELESRVDELRGQNRTLTFDRQNAECKITSLVSEAEKLREEHELLLCQTEDKMRRQSEELDGLRSSVQQKDTELHTIKGILRDSESTNHQLQREIATLQTNNTELSDKLTVLEKQLALKDREGETVQKQCQELMEALSRRDEEVTELKCQLEAVEERLKVEQGEREKAQWEREQAQSEREKAQEESQLLVETLTQKEKLLVQRQSAEKETETKLKEKMTQISEIEERLSNKKREFDNLADHLEEREKAWKEELSVKDGKIDRLTSLNKETRQLIDSQNQQHVEDIRQREIEIQRIEAELSQKLDAEREMKQIIEQQIKEMDAKEIQIKDYQLKLSQLTSEIDSNQKEIEDMKSSHKESVEVLQEKVRNEAVVNKDLLVKISALEESNAALGEQLNEVEEKCERLKSELRSEVESRLNEKHHQIEQLREDIGELKENIGSSEQTEEGIPVLESLGKLQTALSRITDSMRVETGGGLQVEDTPSQYPESDKLKNQWAMIVETLEQRADKSIEQTTAESCQTTDSVTKVPALVEIHELKESVKALQAQVQELQKDKNHLKTCLKEATQGLSQGDREEMEAVLEENSHLMEEIKALSGELEKLKSRAEKEEKTVTYSDNTEDQLQKKFDLLTMENRNLREGFSDLEREIEQGQSQILQMTLMFEQSVSANEVLRDEILSLKEELENIAESRENVDLALTNMEQRVSQQEVRDDLYSSKVKSEVIQPSKDSSEVESEVTWPSKGSSEVKSEVTQPSEDSSKVKSEATQPSRDSSKVTQPNEDSCGERSEINQLGEILVSLTLSNSQNVLLKEENEKLKGLLLDKEKLLENSFQQMENDSSVIVERSKTIEGELEDARRTLAEREELIHILEEQVKLVSRENSEMREERETIIEEVKVHRDITSEMRDSVEKSRQDVSEIRKEQSGFKLKMDEIIEEKDKLARDLMKRITENQELRTKVGILSIENDTLKQSQESFERVKAERDELLSMQEKLLEDLTEMQGRYEAVHSMMEETKQECNSEMERLRQQLGAVNRDVGSLKTSIDVLQSELQSTQEQKEQLMSSLEDRTGELGVTEKERVKEVNDKINKELQNQRRACVGSINAEACGGPSNVEPSRGSNNAEALVGPNNEAYRGSAFDEVTPDGADVVDSRSRSGNSYDREIETVESDHNSSKEENIENGGMGECGMEEDNQEEILRPDSLAAVSERDLVVEETEMVSEGRASEQSFVEKSDEQDGMDTELERDSIRQELETEYNQKVEGLRYEMEERLEMSLKDKEFELLGKFDVEKRALVQQMEQSLGQRIEAVKAEKHKEFVEAMQRVRKDQGKKLQKEVKGRHRVQKQLQEVSEERDELRSELSHLHQQLSRTQVGTMIDSVFTEPDQFQQSSSSHLNSSFISESISPPSSLNLGSEQEWFCGNSACQKMFQSYKDLSDRVENMAFQAPGSGRSDLVTDDRNVEQGFQPEILGEERLLDETNFGLQSGGSDVMRDQKNRKRHKSLSNEQDGNDKLAELAQGFQPECDEVFSENNQDGEYLSEVQKIQIGFNPAEHESFKDIRDQDLQASRLSLNLDSAWESQGVQRSISEDCPPQFSPELKKLKVFPASAPVHHFLKEPDEGFIPSRHGGDNTDSNDCRRMSETEDSENEVIPAEKLLRIQESELHLLKNKIEEMMDEKSELTEKCLTLNTRVEQEILLRQGLEQELNSLVEDLSTTEPASNTERLVMSDNPQKNDGSDRKERKASSLSIESLESKLKGLSFLYEKEKQLREGLELKLNTEKLYRKDLEKEIKSLSISRDPPLSAGPHFPGGKSSRRGRALTQRQFSYEAEDAGQHSGVLSLFCSEHYREMESRVHQLQFQNQFLSEKIRIVESLNNGERKALVEKNRKLESELKELRHGSVFVEEDEELVVEDVMSKSSSGPGFLTEEDVKLTEEDIQRTKEGSVEDGMSSRGSGFLTKEDVKKTKKGSQHTKEDVKKTKKGSQQTKEDGKQTKKGIMEDKVDDNSNAGAEEKQVYFEDMSTETSLVKKEEPEKLLSEEISIKSEGEISSTSQEKNQEDVSKLREMLNALNIQLELLRRDNLSLQLEMKEKDDFLEHVESRTKVLVSDLKREQSECIEARHRVKELGEECLSKEQDIKEIVAELSILKDRLDEEKLKNSSLKLELGKIRDQEVLNVGRSCQTEEWWNGDVKHVAERTREVESDEVQTDPDLVYTGHVGSQAEEVSGLTKAQQGDDGVKGVQTSEKETQAECGQINSEDRQTQTDTEENHKVSQKELEAMKSKLQEKEDYIKRLEDELDQMETSGDVEDPEDLQEFQEYRNRTERALKEKETYIRKLEEHLLGRETPERNLKALQEKLCVEEAPKVKEGGKSVEDLHIHTETDDTQKNPLDETVDKADVKATIDPLLPWHSPLDDLSEPSNYSVRSASHLEISTSVPEVIPESRDLFSPGLSVCSTSSTFSGGSWDQGLERIVSGLGPEEDGHKALEHKHFELIDEISNLRKDLKDTKSIYTQENALLQEALDREKWMSGSLRSKLGMSNTVVNFDLSAEIISLRQKVSVLQETNKMLQTENDRWLKRVQEQERLVMDFKGQQTTNRGLQGERDEAFTRQVALLQQHRQELMDQLKERELENNKLSSKLGDQMILEENLRREKDLLKVKLSERESIEDELHEKKMELQRQVGYQRKLEDIIYHKNLIEKELMKQKRLLEMDFLEIESKLQEKEELLEIQRSQLLRELRMKDQILALGSEAGSEITGSRVQSPSFSETSSIHSGGLMSRGSRHHSVDLNISRSSEMVSGCHSVDLNISRLSEREAGRVGVMLTDAEKQHLSAIEFLKGKLKSGSDQNLHKRESKAAQSSDPVRGSTGDVGKGSGHPRQHSGSLGSGDHAALQ